MIVCKCGHENKTLNNPRFWADLNHYIGDCHGCKTSIHFEYKGSDIVRASLPKSSVNKWRKSVLRMSA